MSVRLNVSEGPRKAASEGISATCAALLSVLRAPPPFLVYVRLF